MTERFPHACPSARRRMLLVPGYVMLRRRPAARSRRGRVADGMFATSAPPMKSCARYPHLTPLALPGKLLMPGFIDAHHHLTQTFGKSLAFGEPSEIFRRIWVPLEGEPRRRARLSRPQARRARSRCAAASRRSSMPARARAATPRGGARHAGGRPALRARLHLQRSRPTKRRPRARRDRRRAQQHLARWEGACAGASVARDLDAGSGLGRHAASGVRAVRRGRRDLPDPCQRASGGGRALAGATRHAADRASASRWARWDRRC